MTTTVNNSIVVRNARGLSLAGTRITLYDLLDYLAMGWPPSLIRHRLGLTEEQLTGALDYLAAHRDAVEAEYRQIVQEAEETRRYWLTHNQTRPAPTLQPGLDRTELRAKIQAKKAKLGLV